MPSHFKYLFNEPESKGPCSALHFGPEPIFVAEFSSSSVANSDSTSRAAGLMYQYDDPSGSMKRPACAYKAIHKNVSSTWVAPRNQHSKCLITVRNSWNSLQLHCWTPAKENMGATENHQLTESSASSSSPPSATWSDFAQIEKWRQGGRETFKEKHTRANGHYCLICPVLW